MGIGSFKNRETEELARGLVNKGTRRLLPLELHAIAFIKLQILRSSSKLSDLRNFPGLRLEQLKGDRRDEYSIRINKQYRICFLWEGQKAYEVSIEDYH
jgi:proteic killer suppression protein